MVADPVVSRYGCLEAVPSAPYLSSSHVLTGLSNDNNVLPIHPRSQIFDLKALKTMNVLLDVG